MNTIETANYSTYFTPNLDSAIPSHTHNLFSSDLFDTAENNYAYSKSLPVLSEVSNDISAQNLPHNVYPLNESSHELQDIKGDKHVTSDGQSSFLAPTMDVSSDATRFLSTMTTIKNEVSEQVLLSIMDSSANEISNSLSSTMAMSEPISGPLQNVEMTSVPSIENESTMISGSPNLNIENIENKEKVVHSTTLESTPSDDKKSIKKESIIPIKRECVLEQYAFTADDSVALEDSMTSHQYSSLRTFTSTTMTEPTVRPPKTKSVSKSSNKGKKYALDNDSSLIKKEASMDVPNEAPDKDCYLKYTYGLNLWLSWVTKKNKDYEQGIAIGQPFHSDMLKLRRDELLCTLELFLKEIRSSEGSKFSPDYLLYIFFGIQEYLYVNGRFDHIFSDPYFDTFTSSLHKIIMEFKLPLYVQVQCQTVLTEEHLWESKQLGSESPRILIDTLIYFNTKYFLIRTLEEHRALKVGHVKKLRKPISDMSNGLNEISMLTLNKPYKSLPLFYHQSQNQKNRLRCPVSLHGFYLSKCSNDFSSIKESKLPYYLLPRDSCLPDDETWFTSNELPHQYIDQAMHKFLLVREVQELFALMVRNVWMAQVANQNIYQSSGNL